MCFLKNGPRNLFKEAHKIASYMSIDNLLMWAKVSLIMVLMDSLDLGMALNENEKFVKVNMY